MATGWHRTAKKAVNKTPDIEVTEVWTDLMSQINMSVVDKEAQKVEVVKYFMEMKDTMRKNGSK